MVSRRDVNDLLQRLEQACTVQPPGRDRPFVTVSWAQSLDGCLSRGRGQQTAISGPDSSRLTHALRARHDAVLVGIETLLTDDPRLTTRHVDGPSPRPVILDSRLRTPAQARVFAAHDEPPLIVCARGSSRSRRNALRDAGAEVLEVPGASSGVSLASALEVLADRDMERVMIEGGARVLASFFAEELVDFVAVTVAPRLLGNPDAVRINLPYTSDIRAVDGKLNTIVAGDDLVLCGAVTSWKRGEVLRVVGEDTR